MRLFHSLLDAGLSRRYSPAADRLLRQYDLQYATRVVSTAARHPLSIDPTRTWCGLAFLGCFGELLVGLARFLTRKEIGHLAAGVTALGAALALVGIVQQATFTGKIYGFWQPIMGRDPFGPFVNRNHLAGWMLMGFADGDGAVLWPRRTLRRRDTVLSDDTPRVACERSAQ